MYKYFKTTNGDLYYLSGTTGKFHCKYKKDTKSKDELKNIGGQFIKKTVYSCKINVKFKTEPFTWNHNSKTYYKGMGLTEYLYNNKKNVLPIVSLIKVILGDTTRFNDIYGDSKLSSRCINKKGFYFKNIP